ncbi:unnamed protein product, partial [Urochloa humidicola]
AWARPWAQGSARCIGGSEAGARRPAAPAVLASSSAVAGPKHHCGLKGHRHSLPPRLPEPRCILLRRRWPPSAAPRLSLRAGPEQHRRKTTSSVEEQGGAVLVDSELTYTVKVVVVIAKVFFLGDLSFTSLSLVCRSPAQAWHFCQW